MTIYTIDPRGLVGLGDIDEQVDPQQWSEFVRKSQDSLRVLAEETGGIAVVNQNDFDKALKRIDAETSDYYVLGYYSKNPDPTQAPPAGRGEGDAQGRVDVVRAQGIRAQAAADARVVAEEVARCGRAEPLAVAPVRQLAPSQPRLAHRGRAADAAARVTRRVASARPLPSDTSRRFRRR